MDRGREKVKSAAPVTFTCQVSRAKEFASTALTPPSCINAHMAAAAALEDGRAILCQSPEVVFLDQ